MMPESVALPVLMHRFGQRVVYGLRQYHVCELSGRIGGCDKSLEFADGPSKGHRARDPCGGLRSPRLVKKAVEFLRKLYVPLPGVVCGDLQRGSAKALLVAGAVAFQERLQLLGGCHRILRRGATWMLSSPPQFSTRPILCQVDPPQPE